MFPSLLAPILPASEGSVRSILPHSVTSIRRTYPAHIPLYVCAVLFCGLTLGMTAYWHVPLSLNASLFFLQTVPLFVLLGIGLGALRELVRLLWTRDASPAAAMGRWLKSGI